MKNENKHENDEEHQVQETGEREEITETMLAQKPINASA